MKKKHKASRAQSAWKHKLRRRRKLQTKPVTRKPSLLDAYIANFRNPNSDDNEVLRRLKSESLDFMIEMLKVIPEIGSSMQTSYPKDLNGFRELLRGYNTGRVASELKWAVAVLLSHKDAIKSHLESKNLIQAAILIGDKSSAIHELQKLQTTRGRSIWEIEASLLAADHWGGLQKNRELLRSILENKEGGFLPIIAQFASERAESAASIFQYEKFFERSDYLNAPDITERILYNIQYLKFRMNPQRLDGSEDFAYLMWRDGVWPIVDRYEGLIRILQKLTTFGQLTHELRQLVLELSNAFGCIDFRICNLLHLVFPKEPIEFNERSKLIIKISDHYTVGDYLEASRASLSALKADPCCFDYYELYIKSTVYLNSSLVLPFDSKCISSIVLKAMYDAFTSAESSLKQYDVLTKLSYSLTFFPFGDSLLSYVMSESSTDYSYNASREAFLNSTAISARSSLAYQLPKESKMFLQQLRGTYGESVSIDLFSIDLTQPLTTNWGKVPIDRSKKYIAIALLRNDNLNAAISSYKSLYQFSIYQRSRSDAARGLLDAYNMSGQIDRAAELLVDSYVTALMNWPIHAMRQLLNRYEVLMETGDASGLIVWPILYHIHYKQSGTNPDNFKIYQAYDTFLASLNCYRPSQMPIEPQAYGSSLQILFLRDVCTCEVMANAALTFDSTDDVETERIAICQLLLRIDPSNKHSYSAEITTLTTSRRIRQAILHIDESKIYVDTEGIAKSLDKGFKDNFERYCLYAGLSSDLRKLLKLETSANSETEPVYVIIDSMFEQFISMFTEIRLRFVSSSEFGLDSFLSVRVRHGVLSGALEPVAQTSR